MKPLENARIAIVHGWLIVFGGSERVVVDILKAFPQADLFAIAYDREGVRGTPLENVPVRTTFGQVRLCLQSKKGTGPICRSCR